MIVNPEARAALEAAIDARIATGVKAQCYSTDDEPVLSATTAEGTLVEKAAGVGRHQVGCTGDDCYCRPDRPDPVSEKACNDHAAMRAAIATLVRLEGEYEPTRTRITPGYGPCPTGSCADHWRAGIKLAAKKDRYTGLCRRCGDYRARNGYPIPPRVLAALHSVGYDWSHWRVVREQRSA